MKVDGACHCGRITFTGDVDPGEVSICHCTDCQNSDRDGLSRIGSRRSK